MRYGHYFETNIIYSPFFTIGILLIAMTVFFIVFLAPARIKPEHKRFLDILKIRYAKNEIDHDKYYEVKAILKDEDSDSPAIMALKQRYAAGNLDSVEFIKMRDEINFSF